MAIIKCPECDLQVSDKAAFCPHCGYVVSKNKVYVPKRKSNKRRRLPNGFGQISELKGKNLRKPFRAMVTVRKTCDGKFVTKLLQPQAYFSTYNEAYEALLEYNRDPYSLDTAGMSVKELYEKWIVEYRKTLKAESSERTISSAWRYCSSLYEVPVKNIRPKHIKGVMDNGTAEINGEIRCPSASTKSRIKSLFNLMLDYALEYELVDKNYARTFNISDEIIDDAAEAKKGHIAFTSDELATLWDSISLENSYIDIILFQCYSGWRPQELGLIKISNVNLDKWEIVGGMKTQAGTDRLVPIHPKVRDIVIKYYKEAQSLNSEYLFNCTDATTHCSSIKLTYDRYQYRFNKVIKTLGLNDNHRPHDGRKTFVTLCKKNNVDEYAIKYIAGHAINDLTEAVYTQRDPQWLHNEIAKIQ